MATTKPRILVTLEPEVYQVLQKLAKHRKRPISAIVREVVDLVHEPYARLNDFWDGVEQKKQEIHASEEEIRDGIRSAFFEVDAAAHAMLGLGQMRQLDFYDDLVTATGIGLGSVEDEPPPQLPEGPPSTNRGVRSPRVGSNDSSLALPTVPPKKPRKRSQNG